MSQLLQAAREIEDFCLERKWQYCLIGGVAVLRWGEPRTTRDVDVTLLAGFGEEPVYIDKILEQFSSRIHGARDFAIQNRVLLVRASNGTPIDIALGGIPFEQRVVERATQYAFTPSIELTTCSAEDLLVMKAFAGRDQDWLDVKGVIRSQGERLDWRYIEEQLPPLCEIKGDYGTPRRVSMLRDQDS